MRRLRAPNYRFYAFVLILLVSFAIGFWQRANPKKAVTKTTAQSKQKSSKVKKAVGIPKRKSITIAAGGDVMFDRRVKSAVIANGAGWPFSRVSSYLKGDLAIVNLESSTATDGKPASAKDVVFQGSPLGAQALKMGGVDIVGLANNHALDYGLSSLQQTRSLLNKQGIAFAGAGANIDEAYRPAIVNVGDLKVGFLSFSDVIPFTSFPTGKAPGIAPARDPKKVATKIKALAEKVHLVIVAFHWGKEYEDNPTAKQKELAVAAVDAGADLVLGTHPHVTQGVAMYKGRLILYSLGNFVFDHYKAKTGESFIFRADLDYNGKLSMARIWPILITDSGQPYVPDSSVSKGILSRVKTISGKYGNMLKTEGGSLVIKVQDD